MIACNRCKGTGFLNADLSSFYMDGHSDTASAVLKWIVENIDRDVSPCDCCGDGYGRWYGTPGEHYGPEDPQGPNGPYAYNGGLCECH